MERNQLESKVDCVFPAADIKVAIKRAGENGGAGKVFVTFE